MPSRISFDETPAPRGRRATIAVATYNIGSRKSTPPIVAPTQSGRRDRNAAALPIAEPSQSAAYQTSGIEVYAAR